MKKCQKAFLTPLGVTKIFAFLPPYFSLLFNTAESLGYKILLFFFKGLESKKVVLSIISSEKLLLKMWHMCHLGEALKSFNFKAE